MVPPLQGIRVLELPGQAAGYCGRLLADLGASVVKIEPPEGDPTRSLPPVADEPTERVRSLVFCFLNANKRGITLDIDRPGGQALFGKLAAMADILLECFPPGFLSTRGLDPHHMASAYPRLIVTSVTPFGHDGPYAHYKGDDLISLSMGGLVNLAGQPGRPPLRAYGFQAYMIASLHATTAILIALLERQSSGLGQWIDVSIQECVANTTENAIQFFDLEGKVRRRLGLERSDAATGIFPCADGEVYMITSLQGALLGWDAVPRWLRREGLEAAQELEAAQWRDVEWRKTREAKATFDRIFTPFSAGRTKRDLYESGQAAGVNICPVNSPLDVCADEQLLARNFFIPLAMDGGTSMTFPGFPYHLAATPPVIRRPAPLLGEHNTEVYPEWLGLSAGELRELRSRQVV